MLQIVLIIFVITVIIISTIPVNPVLRLYNNTVECLQITNFELYSKITYGCLF